MVNSKFMPNSIFMEWCIARKQRTCTGGTGTGGQHLQYNMAARVTRRPDSLASFFTAARQLVSEVESYFSSD